MSWKDSIKKDTSDINEKVLKRILGKIIDNVETALADFDGQISQMLADNVERNIIDDQIEKNRSATLDLLDAGINISISEIIEVKLQ